MRDLVDYELQHELAPAQAPDELWDRLCGKDVHAHRHASRRPWLATATLTILTVVAFSFTLNHAEGTDQRASDAVEFSCQPSQPVSLASARVVRARNVRVASVGFELPHRPAAASAEDGCALCHAL